MKKTKMAGCLAGNEILYLRAIYAKCVNSSEHRKVDLHLADPDLSDVFGNPRRSRNSSQRR